MTTDILSGLNERQREAAETIEGPLLIVAGPGSGKTRLITYRIAYLMRVAGVSPARIAALTFTNKAAREMKSRIEAVASYGAERLTMGTFHSFCARTLRIDGDAVGLERSFAIYDDGDQIDMIKRCMAETDVDPKQFAPRAVLSAISSAKSQLLNADGFGMRTASYFEEVVGRVYKRYEALMAQSNAVDFDDLLLKTFDLLNHNEAIAAKYQERYVHLMIDEFQDTNVAQYAIARLIAQKRRNLCVVGDPDQSIYSWRNADIRNILSFQRDFPDGKTIALEQNYRSTQTILDAASKLISVNDQRVEKRLFTTNGAGARIAIAEAYDENEEAELALREIFQLRSEGYSLGDVAVMYRVNAQSRALEQACGRFGVDYQIVGGTKFFQRREVKDVAAYLRLLANANDDVSFQRVVNLPPRGIGARTLDELLRLARAKGTSMFDAISDAEASASQGGLSGMSGSLAIGRFTPRSARALADFRRIIEGLRADMANLDLPALIERVMTVSGYRKHLTERDELADERLENIAEFSNHAAEFASMPTPEALAAFLESVSLVSDVDGMEEERDKLTLITLHQAKGLEYPVVFMVGMEDGLLPHSRSLDDPASLEEERRLCYVGMTRAKRKLYLTRAFRRGFRGGSSPNLPSRFLLDIPQDLVANLGEPSAAAEPQERRSRSAASGTRRAAPEQGFQFGRRERGSTNRERARRQRAPSSAPRASRGGSSAPSRARRQPPAQTRRPGRVATPMTRGDRRQPRQPAAAPKFATGDKVRHAKFGEGMVTACEPSGGDYQVTVAFTDGGGVKRLLLSFAPLEKVE